MTEHIYNGLGIMWLLTNSQEIFIIPLALSNFLFLTFPLNLFLHPSYLKYVLTPYDISHFIFEIPSNSEFKILGFFDMSSIAIGMLGSIDEEMWSLFSDYSSAVDGSQFQLMAALDRM